MNQLQSITTDQFKEPRAMRGTTQYRSSLLPHQSSNQIHINNFIEQLDNARIISLNQKQVKQNFADQLTISQINDYKVSPINRDANFSNKEGNPCSSIEQQQDSDISVQGLSPFLLNKDNLQGTQKQEKNQVKAFDKKMIASKSNMNMQKNQKKADDKPFSNNLRIMIQKKQKQKLLNGFKKSIETQKEYIENRMQKYIEQQQQVQRIEEKHYDINFNQVQLLKQESLATSPLEFPQEQKLIPQEFQLYSNWVQPFYESPELPNLQHNKVTQFKLDDDIDYDTCLITSLTTATSQNSNKIYLFSNPSKPPEIEAKDYSKQPSTVHHKQTYCGQTEQTQESSGEESYAKEKDKKEKNSHLSSKQSWVLTQTVKQKKGLNSLIQSPCMTKEKFDYTLTQKKDSSTQFYSSLNTCHNTNSTNKSILKISPPFNPSKNDSFLQNGINRNVLFKINKNSGNLLKKESNFASQIKLIPDKKDLKIQVHLKPSIPFRQEVKKSSQINTASILNLRFKEQQKKVVNLLQKTLNKQNI